MSASSTPDSAASPTPSMPASVRVAVMLMAVLAILLLSNAAILWFGYDAAVDRIVSEGDSVSRAEAGRFVTTSLVPNVVIGLLLALSAWFLPRRQPWARWTGLAATSLLALVTLFSVVSAGGVTVASLLLVVLSVASVTSLLARPTGEWLLRPGPGR